MSRLPDFSSTGLVRLLAESSRRSSELHGQFLSHRQNALRDVKNLIELQINAAGAGRATSAVSAAPATRPALFSSRQLDEFGVGRISQCLGPAFSGYDQRRIPRIPNGELKMMSRIVAIQGCPRDFNSPASVEAEYDVPVDAWYLRDGASPEIPLSLWMEIALQPCGFLSAYLDSYAFVPHNAFFFRNLDGGARFFGRVDVRGQTITTRARLLTSVVSGGTVIQKYAFELTCAGRTIYQGESTFGYFSAETMGNQVGLDGGKTSLPWLKQPSDANTAASSAAARTAVVSRWQELGQPPRLARGRLSFLNEVSVVPGGGRYGSGYVYAARPVDPSDWFYPFHFYQDPVMPGSLGVEAILQAMQVYALEAGLSSGLRSPRFGLPVDHSMNWRYRGQITPQHRLMELDVHFHAPRRDPQGGPMGYILSGDANLWVDGLRIYEVKNAAVAIVDG